MFIGIDLGGTNTAAAIVEVDGKIIKRTSIPTDAGGGAFSVVNGLLKVCETLLEGVAEAPTAIGIGVPGTVNDDAGEVLFTPNLPLSGYIITDELKKKYGCPVLLGNDANCAALGETVAGGAKGAKNVVFITLGTGVGGGVILDGRLHTGLSGAACELGHMVIISGGRKCGCGRLGCWESYASATGLVLTTLDLIRERPDSLLWELCGGDSAKVDGRMIFKAFRAGDHAALTAVELYTGHLAAGIINLINVLDPEMICVGGGISNEWDCLADSIQGLVDAENFFRYVRHRPKTRIVRAELGNDAGIIGAAMLGRG